MADRYGPQRQRHGVTKNLVEGVGGVIVGMAAFLFLADLFRRRATSESASAAASAGSSKAPEEDSTT